LKVSTLPHLSTGGPDADPFAGNGGGSVLNIPFITQNANVTAFSSTFWIETVAAPVTSALPGESFQQLQYAQDITLEFFDRPDGKGKIKWPHITIATLVKQ